MSELIVAGDQGREVAIIEQVDRKLAVVSTVEDALDLRAQITMIQGYLKKSTRDLKTQNKIAVARIKCDRLVGNWLSALPTNSGQLCRGSTLEPRDDTPTLKDLGLTKSSAHRLRKLAAIPEEVLDQYAVHCNQESKEVTVAGFLTFGKSETDSGPDADDTIEATFQAHPATSLFELIDEGKHFESVLVTFDDDLGDSPIPELDTPLLFVRVKGIGDLFKAGILAGRWGFNPAAQIVLAGRSKTWSLVQESVLVCVRDTATAPSEAEARSLRELIEGFSRGPHLAIVTDSDEQYPGWTTVVRE